VNRNNCNKKAYNKKQMNNMRDNRFLYRTKTMENHRKTKNQTKYFWYWP